MKAFWLPAVCALVCVACGSDEDDGATPTGPSSASGTGASGGSSSEGGAGGAGPASSSGNTGGGGAGAAGGSGGSGGGTTGDFACVGTVTWPAPAAGTVTVELNVSAEKIQGGDPLPDILVKACGKLDTTCAVPLAQATTNIDGEVSIEVPVTPTAGFDGYFELSGDDIPPSLVFVFPPVYQDIPPGTLSIPLVDNATLGLLDILGIELSDARATLAMIGQDCAGEPANGLSFTSTTEDGDSTHLYVSDGLPAVGATSTDETGVGAIFNVVAGPVDVTSTIEATSQEVGTISVFTRAGAITYAVLPPTP